MDDFIKQGNNTNPKVSQVYGHSINNNKCENSKTIYRIGKQIYQEGDWWWSAAEKLGKQGLTKLIMTTVQMGREGNIQNLDNGGGV